MNENCAEMFIVAKLDHQCEPPGVLVMFTTYDREKAKSYARDLRRLQQQVTVHTIRMWYPVVQHVSEV